MRILLVNDYAPPCGGAEIIIHGHARELIARGHEVRMLTSRAGLDDPAQHAYRPDFVAAGTMSAWRTPLQVANPGARAAVRRAVREFRPEVVHVGLFLTQLSPLALDPLEGVPTLYHAQWYRAVCPTGGRRLPNGAECTFQWGRACRREGCLSIPAWGGMMIQRRLWHARRRMFDLVVVPSEFVRASLADAGFGRIDVIPNPVVPAVERSAGTSGVAPDNEARPRDDELQRDVEPHGPLVAFAGRLVPEKGAATLLDAIATLSARLDHVRLMIIGDGPERPKLERRATRPDLRGRVEFTGWLERREVERRLSGSSVQVVPSEWSEPFGIVAAEALARGTPVVASDVGALPEIIEDGVSGLLAPPGDAEALASRIGRILDDTALRGRLAEAGLARAERFTIGRFADAMLAAYERTIAA
ncbi:MAG: glycosyltransferase family 4 protein [Gemmatimonadota bacterium]|nr:glycosyltransferase family 4 protein [Gemmatimonadota bacterium]